MNKFILIQLDGIKAENNKIISDNNIAAKMASLSNTPILGTYDDRKKAIQEASRYTTINDRAFFLVQYKEAEKKDQPVKLIDYESCDFRGNIRGDFAENTEAQITNNKMSLINKVEPAHEVDPHMVEPGDIPLQPIKQSTPEATKPVTSLAESPTFFGKLASVFKSSQLHSPNEVLADLQKRVDTFGVYANKQQNENRKQAASDLHKKLNNLLAEHKNNPKTLCEEFKKSINSVKNQFSEHRIGGIGRPEGKRQLDKIFEKVEQLESLQGNEKLFGLLERMKQ